LSDKRRPYPGGAGRGAMSTVPVDKIKIGDRYRRDLGDIDGLARNIYQLGLLHPIVIDSDHQLIAGARRLAAFKSLGWRDVPVTIIDLQNLVDGQFAENFYRKAFTPSEMVKIAGAMESMERAKARKRQGQRTDKHPGKFPTSSGRALDHVARVVGKDRKTLMKAAAVVEAAATEPEKFAAIKADMDESGKVDRAFKQVQIIRRQQEHAARIEPGCTVADLHALAASGKRFPVIYADPPWPWETWGSRGRIHSCADHHYGLSSVDDIKRLPVAQLAADDAVLFLWCTWPHITIGTHVEVIQAWGFKPSTVGFVWIKQNPNGEELYWGNGYYSRSNSEACLIATKGSPLRLAADVHQVVFAPVGAHSEKPDAVRCSIERLFAGPNLELYGRKPVPGWTEWGDEIKHAEFPQYSENGGSP
jgi:N6-adenosine-specific RNA methylase IME4/ParB-like chromosome segregation protein Spo0J